MGFIHFLQPQSATITAATAAGTYCTSVFPPGRSVGQVEFTNGSTAAVYFMLQGCNSTSGTWFDLKAAASTVTSGVGVRVTSTYACIFDRLRIETTAASATTASTSFTFVLSAR